MQNLSTVKKIFLSHSCDNFNAKDAKKRKHIIIRLPYPILPAYDIRESSKHCKIIAESGSRDAKHTN